MRTDTTTREARATELAADPGRWIPCTTRSGATCFAIESQRQPGLFHLATADQCSCGDGTRPCKHMLAVRLTLQKVVGLVAPVLDLVRESDGSLRWEAHHHDNGNITYLPRRSATTASARQYDEVAHEGGDGS